MNLLLDIATIWLICSFSIALQGASIPLCLLGPITYLMVAFDKTEF